MGHGFDSDILGLYDYVKCYDAMTLKVVIRLVYGTRVSTFTYNCQLNSCFEHEILSL